jgi:putative transposase
MTMARAHLVDVSITRWYHCITRCVRRAFLLAEGPENRKDWIEHRLQELAEIFSIAVRSNHATEPRVPRRFHIRFGFRI